MGERSREINRIRGVAKEGRCMTSGQPFFFLRVLHGENERKIKK
jgi:hypothetical protein